MQGLWSFWKSWYVLQLQISWNSQFLTLFSNLLSPTDSKLFILKPLKQYKILTENAWNMCNFRKTDGSSQHATWMLSFWIWNRLSFMSFVKFWNVLINLECFWMMLASTEYFINVTQCQQMRLFVVKLTLSYERKCKVRSKFLKNWSMLKKKVWHKFIKKLINSN